MDAVSLTDTTVGIVAAVVGHRVGQAGVDHIAGLMADAVDLEECLHGQLTRQLPLLDLPMVASAGRLVACRHLFLRGRFLV